MILFCISDVHGNLDALRAVLATAERRVFHKLLVAGDVVFPGPQPLEVWRRFTAANAIIVQGVSDRAVTSIDLTKVRAVSEHERARLARVQQTRELLGELIVERIRRLPTHQRVPLEDGSELTLVHGSPVDPSEPMTHDMDDAEISSLLGDSCGDVVVCGMSHVPFDRTVGGVRVINVGSVGEAPDGVMPGASPRVAHATWIESTPSGLTVEQVTIPLLQPVA